MFMNNAGYASQKQISWAISLVRSEESIIFAK